MDFQVFRSPRATAFKLALLSLFIVYLLSPTQSPFTAHEPSSYELQSSQSSDDFQKEHVTIDVDKSNSPFGNTDTAKLLINPLGPRATAQNGKSEYENCLNSGLGESYCRDLKPKTPKSDSDKQKEYEECLNTGIPVRYCLGLLPGPRNSKSVSTSPTSRRSGALCGVLGISLGGCETTTSASTATATQNGTHVSTTTFSSESTTCYKIFGLNFFCNRQDQDDYEDEEGYWEAETYEFDDDDLIHYSARGIASLESESTRSAETSSETMRNSMTTPQTFSCLSHPSGCPHPHDLGSSGKGRSRLPRCILNPKSRVCRHPSNSISPSTPIRKELSDRSSTIPGLNKLSITAAKDATVKCPSKDAQSLPSIQLRDTLTNSTVDCSWWSPSYINGTEKPIKVKMDSPCSKERPIFRTFIDQVYPPDECKEYFDAHQGEFLRCLEVSKNRSKSAITVYVVVPILIAAFSATVILLCIRSRKLKRTPPQDPEMLGISSKSPRDLVGYTEESRRLCGGIYTHTRSYSDLERDEIARNERLRTLDGANDGWTQWILKKSRGGQNKRKRSPAPRSRAPRIPSLNLPKPSFATIRKVSGLPFDTFSKGKYRASPSKKGNSAGRV